jgi:hypothetical protein
MRRKTSAAIVVFLVLVALLWPTAGQAQMRRHIGGRPAVVVRGFVGFPSYGPWVRPFFSPFYGYPWYGYGYAHYAWQFQPPYYREMSEVRLQVKPKEAEVYADGYFVGSVDDFDGIFQRLDLPAGEHEIVLFMTGYQTVRQTLQLKRGERYRIRHDLVKLAPGQVNEPRPSLPPSAAPPPDAPGAPRARPWNPGPPRGLGPLPRPEPQPRPEPPAVLPPPGTRPQMMPPVAPSIRAQGFGTLVVRVRPPGAEVFVDGEGWPGPETDAELLIQLAEGTHRIEIGKDGYVSFSSEVEIRQGQATPLNVSLPVR